MTPANVEAIAHVIFAVFVVIAAIHWLITTVRDK